MKVKISVNIGLLILSFQLSAQTLHPSFQIFGSPVLHIFESIENVEISQDFNYSYGILIGNSFFLKSGVLSIHTGYFIDTKSYEKVFSDTISWYPKSVHTQFLYRNIPFFIRYSINKEKNISPYLSVGFIFGKILKQKQSWIYNNSEETEGFRTGIENVKYPKYFQASLGFNYRIIENWSIILEPYLKYCINSNSPYNYDKDSNLSLGMIVGLKYDINKGKNDEI